jgi:hypothetical protein
MTQAVIQLVEQIPPEIDRQIRAKKIDLPGGHARIRSLDDMTARQQRPIQLLAARLGDVPEKLQHARRLLVDGDLIEDRTGRLDGPDLDLSARQFELLDELQTVVAWCVLESWSLDRPLPTTPDELLDLDPSTFAVLRAAAAVMLARKSQNATVHRLPSDHLGSGGKPRKKRTPRRPATRIVVPYIDGMLHPETAAALEQHAPRAIRVAIDPADASAYYELLRTEWAKPGDLVIIEQDIQVVDGVFPGFAQCREPVCAHAYQKTTYILGAALGCARFTHELKRNHPDLLDTVGKPDGELLVDPKDWRALDQRVSMELQRRGITTHMHDPVLTHHHAKTDPELAQRWAE